ncbi:ATP-dependent Clp protease proteolytic subunit [Pseudonocardia endophytica]|uniref:ATP-dependent Clp protease proteolytic subunit n=1 Tax=Pseudonocardia endophytica TaxID=401976 RepID=A0A4R1HX84_PSEEN|nr:ATP-dependent Clp protease proteolytic subunit [Pseudonocardia endophytica]TCK26978.1 ATP-dependent Clp protease protease subunit [Pseudonocardia endophytica]
MELGPRGERVADALADRLLDQRIVVLGQEIDDDVADAVCGRLLLLAAENRRHDITLYVSSSGGSPAAATAIHDTMRWVEPDVVTIVHGSVTGAGLLVAAAGARGRRTALPHARFHLTPPPGGVGVTSDVRGRSEELTRSRRELTELIAAYSGHTAEEVAADTERGRWFGATEALGYGLVDRVAGIDTTDSDT